MKPLLHEVVDTLYQSAESIMPDALKERPMAMAPLLGFAGAFALVKGAQALAEKYIPTFYKGGIVVAEKVAKWGIPAAVIAYSAFDNEGAKQILDANPVYVAGMTGAYLGGVMATTKPRTLEEEVKE